MAPRKRDSGLSIVLRRTLSRRRVPLAKTDQSRVTKGNLLYIQTQTSALARHFSAPKRTNVPASAFHKPLDLPLNVSNIIPPTPPTPPVPHPRWRHGRCASHQISGCQGVGDVSCHWNAKAAEKNIGGDRWCEKANIRLDRGAAAQSGRQKSFCLDKPGKPNADELVRKGLATWDIQSVSRRRRARSAKRGTFRGAKLHRWTCQYRHYLIL